MELKTKYLNFILDSIDLPNEIQYKTKSSNGQYLKNTIFDSMIPVLVSIDERHSTSAKIKVLIEGKSYEFLFYNSTKLNPKDLVQKFKHQLEIFVNDTIRLNHPDLIKILEKQKKENVKKITKSLSKTRKNY